MTKGKYFGRNALLLVAMGLLTMSSADPAPLSTTGHASMSASRDRSTSRDLASLAGLALSTAPDQLVPLTQDEVFAANSSLPFSTDPLEPALPFRQFVGWQETEAEQAAIECLTHAIYYEAAVEGEVGQRAVAQVVLNRVRHPAFPSSICGVVYEGSELRTGCQFSFTCDGSLLRRPSAAGWRRARRIAVQALEGLVEASVGMATHYHANYVFPYWAPKLSKVAAIDTHIFYRWRGSWGRRRAFSQGYSGESAFASLGTVQLAQDGDDPTVNSAASSVAQDPWKLRSDEVGSLAEVSSRGKLRADEDTSALEIDASPSRLLIDSKRSAVTTID